MKIKRILSLLAITLVLILSLSSCSTSSNVYNNACANAYKHQPSGYAKSTIAPAPTTPIRGNFTPNR